MLNLTKINDHISYIEPTANPLSANVAIIKTNKNIWLYDVGNNPDIPDIIDELNVDKLNVNVILSHFHPDHIGNINKINGNHIYQSKNTFKYTKVGDIVDSDIFIEDDNIKLHIFPVPSSHAKGCIALEVDEQYCFLGDAIYPKNNPDVKLYNSGILKEQIDTLKKIKASKYMLSHKTPFAQSSKGIIKWLEHIYATRKPNEVYINI